MDTSDTMGAYRYIIRPVIIILTIGTTFYHFVEKWSWLDSYYFSVVTLATVGYGDFVPTTTASKLFTTFYIFAGVSVVTTYINIVARRRSERLAERHGEKKS